MTAEQNQQCQIVEILALLQSTLWVLEHPEVNAIKFCGNPRQLAEHIRRYIKDAPAQKIQAKAD